ncbi:Gfo/Idh/MocA family protein [Aquabacterium sp.]|uniref:Gfo/Idh/MocA family protein n=1 Tax=Aquabacterium sp. TaxID=1872578 RepID=UPI002BB77C89|nr:Gfo/Idh/MocA family oxidoreductase [Aquabacterium sp.]HSW04707.1 Gfo/Idh/MocA family oxidoreductase [Aquabacterium sp.]
MTCVLRLGILGTARIAQGFAEGVAGSALVRIDAVASRSADAAAAFADRHAITRAHGSYEALLADGQLDAVYIPLPNSLHAPWTERALRAGLHVLCEKPLTVTLAEAQSLFTVAKASGRVLLEAYPYRYQPQTLRLRQLIDEGAIGDIRLVQACFGFSLPAGADIRLDPALGGGALLDAGCYAVSLARLVAGRRPLAVLAQARWSDSGVDMALTGTVHYEGGAVAQIGCAMDAAVHRQALVLGSAGVIETDYLNHTHAQRPGVLRLRRGVGWDAPLESVAFDQGNGFRFEAEHFARQVFEPGLRDDGDTRLSLENMATLEALLRSAREGRSVDVTPVLMP